MIARNLLPTPAVAAIALAAISAVQPAFALDTPHSCGADPHIQCATFDPDQVYRVATAPGRAVMVQLEPGERVMDKGAGIGDGKAWTMSINDNWVMLKQAAPQPTTNLILVTNRRSYALSLVSASRGQPVTWMLRFDYPDTRAQASSTQARRQAAVAAALGGGQPVSGPAPAGASVAAMSSTGPNQRYMMRGNLELAPTAAWDDGRFTYFRYATARDLPKVFSILPDGTEATANFHMEGDTIVVHETAKQFVIRYGQAVLGIRNDGYSPVGRYNGSGSSAPGSARLMREQADNGSSGS
jgi:type IV secretion system protein VirB9